MFFYYFHVIIKQDDFHISHVFQGRIDFINIEGMFGQVKASFRHLTILKHRGI